MYTLELSDATHSADEAHETCSDRPVPRPYDCQLLPPFVEYAIPPLVVVPAQKLELGQEMLVRP